MASHAATHIVVVGAGASGLMAAYELARAGARVSVLEARGRCGGRIYPLSPEKFGYPAEGGAEFVHGDAPLTRALMGEAGLSYATRAGRRCRMNAGIVSPIDRSSPGEAQFLQALRDAETDLPIADFLEQKFGGPRHEALRRSVTRRVQGYDLADPRRISTFAIRDEWLARGDQKNGRIEGGYGLLIEHLAGRCRDHGVEIHLNVPVRAIEKSGGGLVAQGPAGTSFAADAVILSVPLPILSEISFPAELRLRLQAARDIGFGNVVKILLRFRRMWWADRAERDLATLSFLQSDAEVPTWWTQYPAPHPVLTGWYPQSRPDHAEARSEQDYVQIALEALAKTFGAPVDEIKRELVASQAIDWQNDPYSRGAYSYATPRTSEAQALLSDPAGSAVYFCGEALYAGPYIGTVEAALASGQKAAGTILETFRQGLS
jgi:monoamine oxidase